MTHYIIEPQWDISDNPDETHFVPCAEHEATLFALLIKRPEDDEPIYIGDITPIVWEYVKQHAC